MNINQRFDEHIKTTLSGLEPDVPSHVWENIVAQRKKKKPLPFWFSLWNIKNLVILGSIIFAGVAITWYVAQNNTSSSSFTNMPIKDKNVIATDDKGISGKAIGINTISAKDSVTRNSNADETKANNNTATINNSSANSKTDAVTIRSTLFVKKATLRFNTKTSSGKIATDIENIEKKNTSVNFQQEDIDVAEENSHVKNEIPLSGTLYGRLMASIEKANKEKKPLGLLKRNIPNVTVPCPAEKDVAGNKKYLEAYVSIDYGIRSLSDTGSSSAYLQKRKESTSFPSGISAGFRYTKVFNNSMSARVGINFSQISEKFTLVQGNLVQITYIINANGDTTGSYTTTGTRYKTTYNKYRTIDIPLLIGYEMGNGRIHTNINAGPVINIYSWQKGDVLDVNGQPVSITTGKSNSAYGFKTNAGLGFMGAISVYYKLTDKLHLMAEPYFRYNFGQMNRTELTIKQKYNTVGLKLGVRLDIP